MNKKLLVILFAVTLLSICFISVTSAKFQYDDYTLKWQFCNLLNFSGIECDTWWSAMSEMPTPNYNQTSESVNESIRHFLRRYYNRSEVNTQFDNYTTNHFGDGTNLTDDDELSKLIETIVLNMTGDNFESRDRLMTHQEFMDSIDDFVSNDNNSNSVGGLTTTQILVGFGAIVLILIAVSVGSPFLHKKYNLSPQDITHVEEVVPRIKKRSQQNQETIKNNNQFNEVDELKKQIQELKEKNKKE